MIGSDGLPHDQHPHPRLWGTFPRVLGHYSRELGLFPLETAVHKMSGPVGAPVQARRIAARSATAPTPTSSCSTRRTVNDVATFEQPKALAVGIDCVLVNGELAYRSGDASSRAQRTVPAPGNDTVIEHAGVSSRKGLPAALVIPAKAGPLVRE